MALILYPELLETRTYPFQRLRYMHEHMGLQEGVYDVADYDVVQRAAGANMSADVGAGSGWVRGDTGTRQGFYHVVNDATVNLAVTAAHATLPRIDQVILRVFDSTVSGGSDVPTLSVLAGTATAGATLDNRTGAAALPNDTIRLADVLVPAASTSVVTANIRDRRPWSRGAYNRIARNANAAAGNDYTTTSASLVEIDATNLKPRIECSGAPLRITLRGRLGASAALVAKVAPFIDGAGIDGMTTESPLAATTPATAEIPLNFQWDTIPSAGSHRISVAWSTSAGTLSMLARSTITMQLVVEELVRQNVSND